MKPAEACSEIGADAVSLRDKLEEVMVCLTLVCFFMALATFVLMAVIYARA